MPGEVLAVYGYPLRLDVFVTFNGRLPSKSGEIMYASLSDLGQLQRLF